MRIGRQQQNDLRRAAPRRGYPPTPPYRERSAPSRSLQYAVAMADAAQSQPVAPRLASVREQLSLLSDYL